MNLAAYEAAKARIFGTAAAAGSSSSGPPRGGGGRREQRVKGGGQEGEEEPKKNRRRGGRRNKEAKQEGAQGQGQGQKPRRTRHHNSKAFYLVSMARGEISAASTVDAHREIMKESELLEEEEGVEEEEVVSPPGAGGQLSASGAVMSLDEVPYDRDLQWCNRATEERPRAPAVGPNRGSTNPFFQVGGGTLLEYEPMDSHYRHDKLRDDHDRRGGGNGGRHLYGHENGGEAADRELYEDDEAGEGAGGSGRRRRRRRGSRGGRRGTPRQDDEYFVDEKAEAVTSGPSRRGRSRHGAGETTRPSILPKPRVQQENVDDDEVVDNDLDLERALPLGMLNLSDDEGGLQPGLSNHRITQPPPLTSVKAIRVDSPLELNAQATPYLPAQAFRGPWTGLSSGLVSTQPLSAPLTHPSHSQPVGVMPMSSRRGYFNQPPMMSQLGRGVKAVE